MEVEKELSVEEKLFEILYGYPERLSQQIIEYNLFDDPENQAIRQLHQNRLNYVKSIIEGKDFKLEL